jgi:hypothetical protein
MSFKIIFIFTRTSEMQPVSVAARFKAYVRDLSPAETVGSNPTRDMDISLL